MSDDDFRELCRVDVGEWRASLAGEAAFLARFGDRLPSGIREEHDALARRLRAALRPSRQAVPVRKRR